MNGVAANAAAAAEKIQELKTKSQQPPTNDFC